MKNLLPVPVLWHLNERAAILCVLGLLPIASMDDGTFHRARTAREGRNGPMPSGTSVAVGPVSLRDSTLSNVAIGTTIISNVSNAYQGENVHRGETDWLAPSLCCLICRLACTRGCRCGLLLVCVVSAACAGVWGFF